MILQRNYEYLAIVGMKFAIYKNVTRVCVCVWIGIKHACDMLALSAELLFKISILRILVTTE